MNKYYTQTNLIIVGHFNTNPNSHSFSNIINDLNQTQCIAEPTHIKGRFYCSWTITYLNTPIQLSTKDRPYKDLLNFFCLYKYLYRMIILNFDTFDDITETLFNHYKK